MPNYSQAKIYKLCCRNPEIKDIYVGSTCNFTKRKYEHKSDCNNINSKKYNLNVYQYIRDNGNWENWDMVLLEEYKDCSNKMELHARERYWLEKLGATLNSCIPNRSVKEYYEKNKEEILEKKKERYKNNKEEYNKKYNEKRKEKIECDICGKIMRKDTLNRHKKNIHN